MRWQRAGRVFSYFHESTVIMLVVFCLLIILTKNRPYFAIFFHQRPIRPWFLEKWRLFCNCLINKWLCSEGMFGCSEMSLRALSYRWFYLVISVILPCHFSGFTLSFQWFDKFNKAFWWFYVCIFMFWSQKNAQMRLLFSLDCPFLLMCFCQYFPP